MRTPLELGDKAVKRVRSCVGRGDLEASQLARAHVDQHVVAHEVGRRSREWLAHLKEAQLARAGEVRARESAAELRILLAKSPELLVEAGLALCLSEQAVARLLQAWVCVCKARDDVCGRVGIPGFVFREEQKAGR